MAQIRLAHANATVGNLYSEDNLLRRSLDRLSLVDGYPSIHHTFRRELEKTWLGSFLQFAHGTNLERVTDQILQDLSDSRAVSIDRRRHVRVNIVC